MLTHSKILIFKCVVIGYRYFRLSFESGKAVSNDLVPRIGYTYIQIVLFIFVFAAAAYFVG